MIGFQEHAIVLQIKIFSSHLLGLALWYACLVFRHCPISFNICSGGHVSRPPQINTYRGNVGLNSFASEVMVVTGTCSLNLTFLRHVEVSSLLNLGCSFSFQHVISHLLIFHGFDRNHVICYQDVLQIIPSHSRMTLLFKQNRKEYNMKKHNTIAHSRIEKAIKEYNGAQQTSGIESNMID